MARAACSGSCPGLEHLAAAASARAWIGWAYASIASSPAIATASTGCWVATRPIARQTPAKSLDLPGSGFSADPVAPGEDAAVIVDAIVQLAAVGFDDFDGRDIVVVAGDEDVADATLTRRLDAQLADQLAITAPPQRGTDLVADVPAIAQQAVVEPMPQPQLANITDTWRDQPVLRGGTMPASGSLSACRKASRYSSKRSRRISGCQAGSRSSAMYSRTAAM